MRRLTLDTETTGLVRADLPLTDPAQPHLAEVAAILTDDSQVASEPGVVFLEPHPRLLLLDTLIHPEGRWEMPQGEGSAGACNGLTTELCTAHGIPIHIALTIFGQALALADELVVHHWAFERAILRAAWCRAFGSSLVLDDVLGRLTIRDTTQIGRELFPHLPLSLHGQGPSLSTLHEHLFVGKYTAAHRAMPDQKATRRVFREMLRRFPTLSATDSPLAADSASAVPSSLAPACGSFHDMAGAIQEPPPPGNSLDPEDEILLARCIEIMRLENHASVSLFQRRLRLGYFHARKLTDALEARGIIGPGDGAQPRQILRLPDPAPSNSTPVHSDGETDPLNAA